MYIIQFIWNIQDIRLISRINLKYVGLYVFLFKYFFFFFFFACCSTVQLFFPPLRWKFHTNKLCYCNSLVLSTMTGEPRALTAVCIITHTLYFVVPLSNRFICFCYSHWFTLDSDICQTIMMVVQTYTFLHQCRSKAGLCPVSWHRISTELNMAPSISVVMSLIPQNKFETICLEAAVMSCNIRVALLDFFSLTSLQEGQQRDLVAQLLTYIQDS